MAALRYFPTLTPNNFMHHTDSKALAAIKMLKGLPAMINWWNKIYDEKQMRIVSMGDDIRVTPRTFRRIYEMVELSAKVLGAPVPDVFINQCPEVNAFTFGTNSPMIQIYSGLIDLMNEDELQAVIAHEMGHIKCGHVLYKTVANLIRNGKSLLGPLDIVFDVAVAYTLLEWDRKSEYSADRAALLVMQDVKPVISMLMKLAGGSQKVADQIDYEDFLEQSRQFNIAAQGTMGKICKFESTISRSHPFAVMRASEIDNWARSTEYEELIRSGREKCDFSGPIKNAPSGLTAQGGLKRAVRLKWEPPLFTNILGYRIYRSEDLDSEFSTKEISGRDNTEFEDKELGDGKTYHYFVRAKDHFGTESETTEVVTAKTKDRPDPVFELFANGEFVRKVTLRWQPARSHRHTMKLHIYRSEKASGKPHKIATARLDEGVHVDEGLVDGATYFYSVVVDDEGLLSLPSKAVVVTTEKLLNPPVSIRAEYLKGMVSLEWSHVAEAVLYEIYEEGVVFDSKVAKCNHANYVIPLTLRAGKKAGFYVKAVDRHNRKSEKSRRALVTAV